MVCKESEQLEEFVEIAKQFTEQGKVANYIPALGRANKNDLSIAIYDKEKCISAGDIEKKFTLQSISKVIALALALMDRGEEYVFERVGMEPTGDPFNSISKLETSIPSKPLNPMINAGALAVTNMINGDTKEEKLGRLLALVHDMTNNTDISYSEEVAHSEYETSHLNRSLSYFMKQHGIINGDIEELIDLYTKQCAIEVNCLDLSRIGAVFAWDGVDPQTGRRIIPLHISRICKTFMVTCGMYNASGEFAIKIGVPAKSGVSGGILSAVPQRMGIGLFGPALDEKGNSVAGIKLLEMLSKRYNLSMF
ncbi:glutaminase A [Lottiidibacillus patelloidae]|uniref:Glutaminase n=1 Tax=Lottiidibacillus patelloidae TaxID=2670334 RepID=A0A263BXR0_9BACI|nr:glutaminase A [Lottiidibacillus patelloidae]OZM58450.1 glutaminase A [Lottiidibacillus patelloidae]